MSFAALALMAAGALAESNLLRNGDFTAGVERWTVVTGQNVSIDREAASDGVGLALKVEVVRDGGSSDGQIYQNVPAKPRTLYRLEGHIRSTRPGLAFLSIKLRRDGHEMKRMSVPVISETNWTAVTHEFSSGATDEIQVLCRWKQNARRGWVGQSGWFAGLRLIETGEAPPPSPWAEAISRAVSVEPAPAPPLPLKSTDADLFVTPSGAGRRDGTSWSNALPGNAAGVLQAAWDALAPGRTCRIGSGIYVGVSLAIASGGAGPDRMKRLAGEDTGAGLPWLVGGWQPDRLEEGPSFLSLREAVSHCAFENLNLARYQFAIHSSKGRHVGLRIRACGLYEFRYGIYLNGLAYTNEPDRASHDLEIANCRFAHFTKSAVRLQGGNYDVRVIDCDADAGGRDWMKESFQICYLVAGDHPRRQSNREPRAWAGEHDILFIGCVARNAIHSDASYWQGDGFCAENDVRNLAFINCASFDNADGGWDVKARNVVYVNCIGLRSKMNFRIWQQAFLYNCLSAYSFKRGGSWTTAGLWTIGDVHASRCTFHNNNSQQILADKKETGEARIALDRCLVTCDGAHAQAGPLYSDESRVVRSDTIEWRPPGGTNPEYAAAAENRAWTGEPPEAFDSRRFGPSRGFHSSVSAQWRGQSADRLVRAARDLLKAEGWADFTSRVARVVAPGEH